MKLSTLLILGAGLGFAAYAMSGETLSNKISTVKNNNPTNIKHSNDKWEGMTNPQIDPTFVSFISPIYGIRAGARNLRTYFSKGLNTVQKIISTWAPAIENDTASYISQVANELGVSPTAILSYNETTSLALLKAIIRREMGLNPFSEDTIITAIRMQ